MFFKKLYVRIWLAVVIAMAVLTFLVGWAWRMAAEPPLRVVVISDEAGQVIGSGYSRRVRPSPGGLSSIWPGSPFARLNHLPGQSSDVDVDGDDVAPATEGRTGRGPEFVAHMNDGRILQLHLPRPPPSFWSRPPFGFLWTLGLVGVAVALATYPIIRKLTRRLERLRQDVEQWGEGDLSVRMPVSGQDEVAFLAGRFNHAAERIENLVALQKALLASQKSLLANASHELRSPLTRIRMGLELMGTGASPSSPACRDEIAHNITELDQLIDEILLASRLDARESDLGTIESVDLVGLAAEECAHVQADLEVLAGDAQDSASLPVQGVTKLLRRAVRNLLENARRHAAGEVTVTLGQVDGMVEIRVCDRGPGVPPAQQERIFEPFYRLPGATERDGGVGLGLALVKSIALRHGGTVHCETRPEGGACFVLRLPTTAEAN